MALLCKWPVVSPSEECFYIPKSPFFVCMGSRHEPPSCRESMALPILLIAELQIRNLHFLISSDAELAAV